MQESVGSIIHFKDLIYAGVGRVYPPFLRINVCRSRSGLSSILKTYLMQESVWSIIQYTDLIYAGVGRVYTPF